MIFMTNRNYSQKREAIFGALKSDDTHPTAETLYLRLKDNYPEISLATVYRNLKLFCDNGDVVSAGIVNGQERFDPRTDEHEHFICKYCGTIMDVDFDLNRAKLYDAVSAELGATVDSHKLTLYGKCKNCLQNKNL